jgi:hypothetical protein
MLVIKVFMYPSLVSANRRKANNYYSSCASEKIIIMPLKKYDFYGYCKMDFLDKGENLLMFNGKK